MITPNTLISDAPPTLHDCVELYGEPFAEYLSDYPIWDESKREWLNGMIYEHFEYREIAQETPAKHLFYMRRTMREMMGAVNPLFRALDSEFDILRSYEQVSTATGDATQTFSNLPQSRLNAGEDYATNRTDNVSTGTTTNYGRADVGSALSAWANSVNNALYIVYNGLEPLYMQVFDFEGVD